MAETAPATMPQATFASASRGFAWSLAASLVVVVVSFAAQIALGRLLTETDFGIYAIAISFSDMISVFRDGGVARWLGRHPPGEFQRQAGKAYLLTWICSLLVAGFMIAAAFGVGRIYRAPEVTPVMLVLAATFPLGAYSVLALAQLQVLHDFRTMAWVKVLSGVVRYGLAVLLALRGFGPFSFVWPVVATTLLELGLYRGLTGLPWIPVGATWADCREVFRETKWSLSGTFSSALLRQSDYATLGFLVPTAVLGSYYFAFQLVMQPVLLFSDSLRRVVLPTFGQFAGEEHRERRSLRYGGIFIGMIAAPLLFLLAVNASALNDLLWAGRWAGAVPGIQVLAAAMPLHLLSLFCDSIAMAHGRFRLWTSVVLLRGLGTVLAAALAAFVGHFTDVTAMAQVMAAYLALSAVVAAWAILDAADLPKRPAWTGFFPPYLIGLVVTVCLVTLAPKPHPMPVVSLVITSGLFLVSVTAIGLAFCRSHLSELAQMLQRLAGRAKP